MRTRKKLLLILLLFIFLVLDVILITRIIGLAQRSPDHRYWEEQLLEAFVPLDSIGGKRQNTGPSHKTVLIHFLPDCHFCQNEAAALRDHLPAFAEARLLLISAAGQAEVEGFAVDYELAGRPNVHFFLDPQQRFAGLFGTQAVPSVFIYDERGRLMRRYRGETRIEAILQHLNSDSHEAISETTY